jgi:hypothetical protein
MVSLFSMALFGMFMLIIMGIVSNTSETAIEAVENQIFLINCPMPLNGALATLDSINGLTVNYTIVYDNDTSDYHITLFICTIDTITGNFTVNTEVYTSGTDWFSSTTGTLFYLSAGITSLLEKVIAFLTLFSFILTPANFSVMGFGLADMSGTALMLIVAVYIVSYVFIVTWMWVTFNPFKGSS